MAQSCLREEYCVEGLPPAVSHYVDAVRYGDLVFVSGLVGVDGQGRVYGHDAAGQARQALTLLKLVLDRVGAGFADVLRVNVFMLDVREAGAVNEVRKEFFGNAYPASTLVGVNSLISPLLRVEIEAVVGLPKADVAGAAVGELR